MFFLTAPTVTWPFMRIENTWAVFAWPKHLRMLGSLAAGGTAAV